MGGGHQVGRARRRLMASRRPARLNALEQRLASVVEAYDRQGIHRSATDVDQRVGRVAGRLCATPGRARHSRAVRPRPRRPAAVISTRRRSPHRGRASVRRGIYRRRRRPWPPRRSRQRCRDCGGRNRALHAHGAPEGAPQQRHGRPVRPAQGRGLAHPRHQTRTLPPQCTVVQGAVRSPDAAGFKRGKRVAQGSCGGAPASDGRGRGDADRDESHQRGREDRRAAILRCRRWSS